MSFEKDKMMTLRYTYSFADDGGATGAITLAADQNAIAEGIIITGISVFTELALTSAGTPTITIGNTGDVDGYLADIWTLANAITSTVKEGEVAGALLWDDTNDHSLAYYVDATTNNQDLLMTVGTAAITAGKMNILIHCYKPSTV